MAIKYGPQERMTSGQDQSLTRQHEERVGSGPSAGAKDKALNEACDECRARKLKCSGESRGCSRCMTDRTRCHYSPRKQMGRPRKRRLAEIEIEESQAKRQEPFRTAPTLAPSIAGLPFTFGDNFLHTNVSSYDQFLDPTQDVPGSVSAPGLSFLEEGNNIIEDATFDFSRDFTTDFDLTSMMVDPAMLETQVSDQPEKVPELTQDTGTASPPSDDARPQCRCLSKLYVTLAAFQDPPPPSFPYSMTSLKRACKLAGEVVGCKACGSRYNTALQNSMLLGTMINLIITDFRRLLTHVEERAKTTEKLSLRMAENNTDLEHLHTGTPDCPMGIDIELDGAQWKAVADKAIRRELFGTPDHRGLAQIVDQMKERQLEWHEKRASCNPKFGAPPIPAMVKPCICTQIHFINGLGIMLDTLDTHD